MVQLSLTSDAYHKNIHIVYVIRAQYKGRIRTYIGYTNNFARRIRQHNGEISGGAKRTSKARPWELLFYTYGFKTHHEALSFEWYLGHRVIPGMRRKKKSRAKCKQMVSVNLRVKDTQLLIKKWEEKYPETLLWVASRDKVLLDNFRNRFSVNLLEF